MNGTEQCVLHFPGRIIQVARGTSSFKLVLRHVPHRTRKSRSLTRSGKHGCNGTWQTEGFHGKKDFAPMGRQGNAQQ